MLITRRIREAGVYAELAPWDTPSEKLSHLKVKGFVLSGGPASVYDEGAPTLAPYVVASGLPVLGICYGMQLLAQSLGGRVAPASRREYGHAVITLSDPAHGLLHDLPATMPVWMSHSDRIVELPPGFRSVAYSDDSPIAAMSNDTGCLGIQFHPEVVHTPQGSQLLRNFLFEVAGCSGDWTAANFVEESIRTNARAGRRRPGDLRALGRRRLRRGGLAGARRSRRPADLHLRRQRPAPRRGAGARGQHVPRPYVDRSAPHQRR